MENFVRTLTAGVLQSVLTLLIVLLLTSSCSAATIDWKGATSTDWGTASNWNTGTLPGSGDAVRIGVVSFTNAAILNSNTTITSITFGITSAITLTVNSGYTLTVSGSMTQNPLGISFGTFTTTIAGGGAITCASLTIGNSTTFPPVLSNNLLEVISTISSFHVTGNVTINSTNFGVLFVGTGYNNAAFSLQDGTTIIDGTILTANTSSGILPTTYATPKFSVDIPTGSALNPILQLTNASALNTASVAGSIDFYNNAGGTGTSTVYYDGTTQQVYANTTACLDNNPETYQYLLLTGSGTKTVDAGTLTVGANLTSTATSVLLNTNNPAATIGGNWTNSSSVTQGSGNITVTGSVTNNSGGTLNLGTGNLYIAANYTNNAGGVYSQSTGTTYFNGSGAQALVDNSITGTTFKLVDFSGGATSTMSLGTNNVNFAVASTGVLTMSNSSKLVAGSSSAAYLILNSDTTGTATVAAIPTGCSITGSVTVQRFVQGNATYDAATSRWIGRNYRLMSSPVNEGINGGNYPYSLNYLGAGTIITDCTSTYGATTGNPSLYLFDENYTPNNVTFISGNFMGVTNISNTVATGHITTTNSTYSSANVYAGDGFMLYFRGDKVTHITGTPSKTKAPYVAPESVTFSATGNLNQGTYSVVSWTGAAGLMYTTSNAGNATVRGFNLVGNPYPSSIDWSTFSSTNSAAPIYGYKVNPTVHILNPITSNYDTYNAKTGIATGSASKIIPSGQGFFVEANAASPTLTFTESAKTNTQVTGSNLLMDKREQISASIPGAYNSYMRIKMVTDSINYNDMVIGFNANASTLFNGNEDSAFLPGTGAVQSIAAISSDSVKASVKWVPLPKSTASLVIRLKVAAAASGPYTLQRTDLLSIPQIYELWLMDNYKKDSLDIRHNSTYAFTIDLTDTATFGGNRFTVVIRQNPALAFRLLNFTAVKAADGSQMAWETGNEGDYTRFAVQRSIDGGATYEVLGGFVSTAQGAYSFMDNNPRPGADKYRLQITDINGNITYSNVITLMYNNSHSLANNNISIYPNPSSNVINLTISQNGAAQTPGLPVIQNYTATAALNPASDTYSASYQIKIINITGSVVKAATSPSANWQDNVSDLTPGTYIIQVVNIKDNSLVGKSTFIKM